MAESWKYTSEQLNSLIRTLDTDDPEDSEVAALDIDPDHFSTLCSQVEKKVFYFGWYWRDVDFNSNLNLIMAIGEDRVGFCENNKWDYLTFTLSRENSIELRKLLEAYVSAPSLETSEAVNGFMASQQPEGMPTFKWRIGQELIPGSGIMGVMGGSDPLKDQSFLINGEKVTEEEYKKQKHEWHTRLRETQK